MNLSDIIKFVSSIAPTLGSVLGGPIGGAAGTAIKLIADKFNADPNNPQDIYAKMIGDPDVALKLKQIEQDHFLSIIQDRDSARKMEEEYLQKTGHANPMLPFLTLLLFISVAGILFCLIKFEIATDIKTVLAMVLTALIREIPDIYRLYFGGDDASMKSS